MLLEQQGKLYLDTPIQTYLPEYSTGEHRVTEPFYWYTTERVAPEV